jgi:N-(2-amino-2-carboxyethyl)-L-glutamate synthase
MSTYAEADVTNVGPVLLDAGILAAVGQTPLVRLERLFPENRFRLYAKLEMLNPGGSIKDRAALSMLLDGYAKGKIGPNTTIVESSSGNLGVGLAQVCRYLNLRFICVVDARATTANLAMLRAYGAEVQVVEPPAEDGDDLLSARINHVQRLCQTVEDCYWVNQYTNVANPLAHYQTMGEIDAALGGRVDYLFVATSTCGTLRGCCEYVRARGLSTKVIAVDAAGSVIFGQKPTKRLIPGHGASRMPDLYRSGLEDGHLHVTDLDCVVGCYRLLRSEAILAGGSSGGVVSALEKFGGEIPPGSNCVAVLCDRGERYLDTIYSEDWVRENFGDTSQLLDRARPAGR